MITSFTAATSSTSASAGRNCAGRATRLPQREPSSPPAVAAITSQGHDAGNSPSDPTWPSSPAAELTKINGADTAAAAFGSAQRKNKINGVKKIPPPTPINPEINPIDAPTRTITHPDGRRTSAPSAAGIKSRPAANKSAAATSQRNTSALNCQPPPRYAQGAATTAKGQNNRHAKCPARTKLVFVCTPNNPTGTANTEAEVLAFARALPEHVVGVFDEAYAEFLVNAPDLRPLIAEGRKIICLRTFSKIYGLASLRVGYGYGSAEMCALLNRVKQPFNVNAIAQAAALAALDDSDFAEKTARENRAGLADLVRGCEGLGLEVVRSVANFMLVRVGDGERVFNALQRRGVIVRPVRSYGLPEWVRITVGTPAQNARFISELAIATRV